MIYFVAKNIGLYGGAAVVAMDVADSFIQSGLEFKAICSQYKIPEERDARLSAMKRLKMPYLALKSDYPKSTSGILRYFLKSGQNRFNQFILDKEIKKSPPHLLIFNGYKPSTMAVINRYSNLCKTMHIVHVSPNYVDKFEDFISLRQLLDVYSKADSLIFVSDECRKAWLEYEVLDEQKSHYIPNCAKEDAASDCLKQTKSKIRDKLDFKPGSFYLVNVASIKKRKGQDLLIDAAPGLKKIAPNLEILIVGSGSGEYLSKMEETVSREGFDFIHFIGHKSNAMEYIYASDLFILPSRAEAFPLAILEAMILKTPVMGSDVDGVPEMIEPDNTGLLFKSDNIEDLTRAFERMYNNKNARERYAVQASKKYWSDFSKEQFTRRYLDVISL